MPREQDGRVGRAPPGEECYLCLGWVEGVGKLDLIDQQETRPDFHTPIYIFGDCSLLYSKSRI